MIFNSERSCKQWLLKNNDFQCDCGSVTFTHTIEFKRRCKRCKLWRSITYGTLFHGVRFGLLKAFRLLIEFVNSEEQLSPGFVANNYRINRKSARKYIRKLIDNKSEVYNLYDRFNKNEEESKLDEKLNKLMKLNGKYGKNSS